MDKYSLYCEDTKIIFQGQETLFVDFLLGSKTNTVVIDLFMVYLWLISTGYYFPSDSNKPFDF